MARPAFTPTSEQRSIVKSMAAMGIPHDAIALKIGIRSPKTIRKHFRQELDLSAAEANYKVAKTLFEMATSGNCPAATIFWMKTHNHRFQEDPHTAGMPVAPPPFIVAREQEGTRQ